jgi:hypothetical protein
MVLFELFGQHAGVRGKTRLFGKNREIGKVFLMGAVYISHCAAFFALNF